MGKEEILKKHTSINKIMLIEHWNADIKHGIKTSGHFVLFEDTLPAMEEYSDQTTKSLKDELEKVKEANKVLKISSKNHATLLDSKQSELVKLREELSKERDFNHMAENQMALANSQYQEVNKSLTERVKELEEGLNQLAATYIDDDSLLPDNLRELLTKKQG
jgi:hypothetical protein